MDMIAYLPQDAQIFDGTVADHIRYGKSDATMDNVRQAAKLAGAESFINNLPCGYETVLGEDAVRLSGGQRQRLDLARALVKQAPILIFDEPTSNLDAESERKFIEVVNRIKQSKTVTIIMVTHRLCSIVDADYVLLFDQGKLSGEGSHHSLMTNNERYKNIWEAQT